MQQLQTGACRLAVTPAESEQPADAEFSYYIITHLKYVSCYYILVLQVLSMSAEEKHVPVRVHTQDQQDWIKGLRVK